ncbi:MAG: hypothetical protein AAFQ66_20010 [Pseudomonadota bacterium]
MDILATITVGQVICAALATALIYDICQRLAQDDSENEDFY